MASGDLRGLLSVLSLEIEPLGTVIGAGVYQIYRPTACWGYGPTTGSNVYGNYQDGIREAWATVVSRLESEAVQVGAHGVLGVSVSHGWLSTGVGSTYQLQLTGSAVRVRDSAAIRSPFLSTLSMTEYLRLLIGGWMPRGLVWAVAATHVHSWEVLPLARKTLLSNMEMEEPTRAMTRIRWSLDHDARSSLRRLGGGGLVKASVTLDKTTQTCPRTVSQGGRFAAGNGLLIDGRYLGTAVVRYRSALSRPNVTLPLDAGANNAV